MIYFNQSPYFQWFLTSQKRQRNKVENQNNSAQSMNKAQNNPKPFTEWTCVGVSSAACEWVLLAS